MLYLLYYPLDGEVHPGDELQARLFGLLYYPLDGEVHPAAMETLIYEYGCRIDKESIPAVNEQFWKAHTLYNNIIAVIKGIREEAELHLRKSNKEYADLCDQQESLDKEFKAAKAANDEEAMKRVRAMEREVWAKIKPVRKEASKHCKEALSLIYAKIGRTKESDTYQCVVKAKSDGLFHNTADMTLDTALKAWDKVRKDGGNLNFRIASLRTTDHIDVRFTCAGGVPAEELLTGRHGLVSLGEPGRSADRVGAKQYPGFRFRLKVGHDATGTWQYHRPLPEGARVTTIRLIRKRVGPDTKWSIQLQLAVPEIPAIEVGKRKPMAAMHFGWSLTDEGARRIAAICDEADPGLAEFIDIPESIMMDLSRSASKRQERDKNRDTVMAIIKSGGINTAGWLQDHIDVLNEIKRLPAERVATKRIVSLSRRIEDADMPNDVLREFAINDHWLWQEESSIRAKALNRRKNWYRGIVLGIVKRYDVIVLSMPDLKDAALRIKGDGVRNELGQIARSARHASALYEFRQALDWAARRAGTVVLDADGFAHVGSCAMCGSDIERVDDLSVCPECGAIDTKANSAARLWQGWRDGFAQAADDAMRLIREKKRAAAEKKASKLAMMFAKRSAIRANARDFVAESSACV